MKPHHHVVTESSVTATIRQRLFMRYFSAIMMDLLAINLIAQFWERVEIDGFLTSLITAILLQLLLQGTLVVEHWAASPFSGKTGMGWKTGRILTAWLILFSSKFVMLWVIGWLLGDSIHFHGPTHGALAFIVTVVAMVLGEQLIYRAYQYLE